MSSASWISARPDASRLDDCKSSDKPFSSLSHEIEYGYRKITPRTRRKPNENYPARSPHTRINQLTEVLILRNQDPLIGNRSFSNVVVLRTRRHFSDCDNIMLRGTKRSHHRKVATFIGQKAHRLSFRALFRRRHNNGLFVRQSVGSIADSCVNILCLESRIGI